MIERMEDSTEASYTDLDTKHRIVPESDNEDDNISVTDEQEEPSQVLMAVSLEAKESIDEKKRDLENNLENKERSNDARNTSAKVPSNGFSISSLKSLTSSSQPKFLHHDSIHAGKR